MSGRNQSPAPIARLLVCIASVCAFGTAVSQTPPTTSPDPFDASRVLEVRITMPIADWDALRFQVRDVRAEFSKERLTQPVPKPYTWFRADVTLDGVTVRNVGVRKRGFFGSAHVDRPALNLDLSRHTRGQAWSSLSRIKLHNNRQDPSQVRQVLAYQVFAAAGVPAPRARLAHVTVNGADLGIYTQIEAIDDEFLQRHFGSDRGNLYEAAISDFRPGWLTTFERKNNKRTPGIADLEAVAQALQAGDDQLLAQLEKVIDVDAFIRFWAVESLINHWDGFCGDQNNAFLYHDPGTDRLRFIAWGADSTFTYRNSFLPFQPPASVLAVSLLPRRLYNHPVTREKYRQRMRELLATVWNDDRMLAEVTRLGKQVAGRVTIPPMLAARDTAEVREFIGTRRDQIETELAQPPGRWDFPMRREVFFTDLGKVSATFSGNWVTNVVEPRAPRGEGRVEIEYYGRRYTGEVTDVKAGPRPNNSTHVSVQIAARFPGVEPLITVIAVVATNAFRADNTLAITGRETLLSMVAGTALSSERRMLAWFGGGGSIRFDQADARPEAPVQGRLEGTLTLWPWDDFDLKALRQGGPTGGH
jgi:hypothetical protein